MIISADMYRAHFEQFGCQFYKIQGSFKNSFSEALLEQINCYGLPNGAIPFFHFDCFLSDLRDIPLEDGYVILGSLFDPLSEDYIYLDPQARVMTLLIENEQLLINSSIKQLISSIYVFSRWLEEQEEVVGLLEDEIIDPTVLFELYYQLHTIDKEALSSPSSFWSQIIHSFGTIEEKFPSKKGQSAKHL